MKPPRDSVAIWDGHFTRPVTRQFTISFCTTCMGRIHDLAQTLPQNMADNADYPALEFVLLDYNSRDGLEPWVREQLLPHIESGRLVYATCTIRRAENESIALAFERTHPDFLREPSPFLPTQDGFFRALPHLHGTDGFFSAIWTRKPG